MSNRSNCFLATTRIILCSALLLMSAGCGDDGDSGAPAPTATQPPASTATMVPGTAVPTTTGVPTSTGVPTLQPTPTPTVPGGGIGGTEFVASLDGDQEVPPVMGVATGTASFTLNESGTAIDFVVFVEGLDPSEIIASHLHAAPSGVNGAVVVPLTGAPSDLPLSGTVTADDLIPDADAGIETFDDLIEAMLAGDIYVNVHSMANQAGEIRGQLQGPTTYFANLSGDQEVPPVIGVAVGTASFVLNARQTEIEFEIGIEGLDVSEIIASHLHVAFPGANGPVVVPLTGAPSELPLQGTVSEADLIPNAEVGVETFADLIAAIDAGEVYVNVHSMENLGGEIRGQLGGGSLAAYPAQECAAAKQEASADYCSAVLAAWADWAVTGDDSARDAEIGGATDDLGNAWAGAEEDAAAGGSTCSDRALQASEATEIVNSAAGDILASVQEGLDPNDGDDARCASDILQAAAAKCDDVLAAEASHIRNLAGDADGSQLEAARAAANAAFATGWDNAVADGCPTQATGAGISGDVDDLTDRIVVDTTVAPHLTQTYETISPTGTTEYLGDALTPICMEGSPYHFFARRGTVNKLVMYYQGGGACWEGLTCSIPVCDDHVDPEGDNPNNFSTGFADLDNPDNPFRDWHSVFVSYCSCDIHFGDAAQDYALDEGGAVHVEHRGFHNSRVAEKWAREHFLNPETVFVTGSSAGAYGAWFNAVSLHDVWPASQFHVLADAGNGVITREFLDGPFSNWDFEKNLPENIPGLVETITEGTGIPGYTEAVTDYYPDTNWAHYSTAYDGGSGGQTGFYNIMLNDNNVAAALPWWEASCAFNEGMRDQAIATSEAVPSNYRYYIGTGSRHTMFGGNKVYDDTTGEVPTIVDWINSMLDSTPGAADPGWSNVECLDCGLTLPGDPTPPGEDLQPPFERDGDEIIINCDS